MPDSKEARSFRLGFSESLIRSCRRYRAWQGVLELVVTEEMILPTEMGELQGSLNTAAGPETDGAPHAADAAAVPAPVVMYGAPALSQPSAYMQPPTLLHTYHPTVQSPYLAGLRTPPLPPLRLGTPPTVRSASVSAYAMPQSKVQRQTIERQLATPKSNANSAKEASPVSSVSGTMWSNSASAVSTPTDDAANAASAPAEEQESQGSTQREEQRTTKQDSQENNQQGAEETTKSKSKAKSVKDSKRAEQNRTAQKAFRIRKEKYVKNLEEKSKMFDQLFLENRYLRQQNMELLQNVDLLRRQLDDLLRR